MIQTLDWHNVYRRGWNGLIVPAAFAHPAKISFGLAEKIYDFLFELGALHAGEAVCDPFGGIAGTALGAMKRGLDWTGVELEEKFVTLGNMNLALWNARYDTLPRWGSAQLLQGDSRQFAALVQAARCAVSSPPFSSYALPTNDGPAAATLRREIARERGVSPDKVTSLDYRTLKTYNANNPHNLGNLPEGDYADALAYRAVVSSPPYEEARIGDSCGAEHVGRNENYGRGAGQLGNMTGGDYRAAIGSPPFEKSLDHSMAATSVIRHEIAKVRGITNTEFVTAIDAKRAGAIIPTYGNTAGNIGNEAGETFWLASRTIVEQVHQVLQSGGAPMPDGDEIDFCDCGIA